MLRTPLAVLATAGLLTLSSAARLWAAEIEPTAADLPGPYAAASYDYWFANADGVYMATIRYPASAEGAPYPAVVYAPGWNSWKDLHTEVGAHLATHGYVVLTFTPPNLGDFQQKIDGLASGLDFLVQANEDPTSPLLGLVDTTRRVVMGHSMGGEAALRLAAIDPTISAVVAEAPSINDFADDNGAISMIKAPTLLQHGTRDGLVDFAEKSVKAYDEQLRAPKQIVLINGGNHVGFTDVGSIAQILVEQHIDMVATISNADQRLLARRYETAWLEYHTKGRSEFLTLINGPRVQQDVDLGLLFDARSQLQPAPKPVPQP